MTKRILLVLFILGLLCFSKTNYSPYSWQITINPKEIYSTIDNDVIYQIKGFELLIWKRLAYEPYIGWPIFTLTGKLSRERL